MILLSIYVISLIGCLHIIRNNKKSDLYEKKLQEIMDKKDLGHVSPELVWNIALLASFVPGLNTAMFIVDVINFVRKSFE